MEIVFEEIDEVKEHSGSDKVQETSQTKPRKLRLLIANDNRFQLLILSTQLAKLPMVERIDEATNGQHALELVVQNKNYDVILLDLDMPIMDGFTCCQKIINHYNSEIPEIGLSYTDQTQEFLKLMEALAKDIQRSSPYDNQNYEAD